MNLTKKQKQELKKIALYVLGLPPAEIRDLLRSSIEPESYIGTIIYWNWVGGYLDAYFNDKSDPLTQFEDQENLRCWVELARYRGNAYIQQSILIFQAERWIKSEAAESGIEYPFKKRSDLLKHLFLEDCLNYVAKFSEGFHESYSRKQAVERLADSCKYLSGEKNMIPAKQWERWQKEDSKLNKEDLYKYRPWNKFCKQVFENHKRNLPSFNAYVAALNEFTWLYGHPESPCYEHAKKYSIQDGVIKDYPGRSKGKKSDQLS